MPFDSVQENEPEPSSQGTAELLEDIRAHGPALLRIEIKYRAAGRGGRFRKYPREYACRDDHDRQYRVAYAAIIGECERIEAEHGEGCSFQASCVVGVPGETEKIAPPVKFRLEETDDDGADEIKGVVSMLTRTLKEQDRLLVKQYGYMENMLGMVAAGAAAQAQFSSAQAETMRVTYDHEEKMEAAKAEADRGRAELDMIRDLAPKGLAVLAAREARQAATDSGKGPKKSLWKHAIKIAKDTRDRPEVAECLGERGFEIWDALADAKRKTEVEGLVGELTDLGQRGEINLWALLTVAPEIGPLLDVLHN